MDELVVNVVGKRYGRDHWALRQVSLCLDRGVLGLVGPNGAGKTTLLRILATATAPTTGLVTWNGRDTARDRQALRRALGYLPQDFGVYPQLTARDFLRYIGELKGLTGPLLRRRVEAVLETVHLRDAAGQRLRTYSGGMIRRIGIAQALLNEPRLLLLDEPTVGLDPVEQASLRRTLAALSLDRLVVLSTHIMSDVESMATDLAVLEKGRLVWAGTPEGLTADAAGQVWSLTVPAPDVARLRAVCTIGAAAWHGDRAQLRLIAPTRPHPLAGPVAPTLEDAYMLFVSDASAAPVPSVPA